MCPHMQQHFASMSSGAPLMRPGQLTHSHTPLMQHSSSTGSDSATSADRKSSSRHAGSNPGNDFDEDLRSGTSPVASLSDGQLTSTPGGPISPHGQVSIVSDSITPSKFGRRGSTKVSYPP
ncbi:unnamed protein product [Dicrocoelium dendriticum]|nr:unnamed protein product [Dicrocoelium dendriticum]